jgi:nucleotide-binding universal stress UspA family protein
MYGIITVPVDNSDHSNAAVDVAVLLGHALGSTVVGSHVYAAKLHDVRFKQMEFTLPDEYKEEEELEKQRKIHDALIARGLHLISDSYLDQMEVRCSAKGIPFERKHFDGKNFEAIAADVNASTYDLLILGALGMGAVTGSQAGSVCERVLRRTEIDTLIVRNLEGHEANATGAIVACLDGSARSYGALRAALGLAKALGRSLAVIAVQEPSRPESALLVGHLEIASRIAREAGIAVTTTLLEGAVRAEIASHVEATRPWLLVLGRTGIDAGPDATEIGGLVEHLVRTATCNVLVSSRMLDPATALASDAAA